MQKECVCCKKSKSHDLFTKHNARKDGLGSYCLECRAKKRKLMASYQSEKRKQYAKNWSNKNTDKVRAHSRKVRYGIEDHEYKAMLKDQNDACKICKTHKDEFKRPLAVDHDHTTGKSRGLLCDNCNMALGKFKDSINTLSEAINYLRRWHDDCISRK